MTLNILLKARNRVTGNFRVSISGRILVSTSTSYTE